MRRGAAAVYRVIDERELLGGDGSPLPDDAPAQAVAPPPLRERAAHPRRRLVLAAAAAPAVVLAALVVGRAPTPSSPPSATRPPTHGPVTPARVSSPRPVATIATRVPRPRTRPAADPHRRTRRHRATSRLARVAPPAPATPDLAPAASDAAAEFGFER